jgi:hypothetical protein
MKRTNQQKVDNDRRLAALFTRVIARSESNLFATISEEELRDSGYEGSMPYPSGTFYDHYAIRQLPKAKDARRHLYSIMKLD